MKIVNYISASTLIAILAMACNDGIDPIRRVDPGPDMENPKVEISYPFPGARIQVREQVAPIDIQFKATDDIEIQSISIILDGTEIGKLTSFTDYRRVITPFRYATLANGNHTLTITATDIAGKNTSASTTFEKVEPYQAKYPGEIFYMPFDGDYLELLSITPATKAGEPVFVDGKRGKALSFNATNKGYVTYPSDVVSNVNSFSVSFWVNPDLADPDGNGQVDGIMGLVNFSNVKGFWGNLDWFVENGSKPSGTVIKTHVTNGNGGESWVVLNGVPNFFGQWSHHVMTYNASDRKLRYYINGTVMVTVDAGWTNELSFKDRGPMVFGTVHFMTNPSLTTGSGAQDWASYLTGELDEIRMFNRALSDTDVQQIYNDEK